MRTALLLVDLQEDFLRARGLLPPAPRLVARAASLLRAFRASGRPVLHVRTTVGAGGEGRMPHWVAEGRMACVEGTPGWNAPALLHPLPGEPIVRKRHYGAFGDARLPALIQGCDAVVLAGVHLHGCVRATALEAYERGFRVLVAEDAVASDDPLHAAATRRWLEARAARFLPADAIAAGEGGAPPAAIGPPAPPPPPLDRAAILRRLAALLAEDAEELARSIAEEVGKPLRFARGEIGRAAANALDAAARAGAAGGEERGASGASARRRPLGLVAAATPWNNPVAIPVGKIAAAVAFGNRVAWKPSPEARAVSERLLALLRRAGAPEGLVQRFDGDGRVARALAEAPWVDAVTLTGSPEAGFSLQEICARRAIPFQAELGGNNGAIVWGDADLAAAAASVAAGAFDGAGQRCTATRRAIVEEARCDEFTALVAAATAALPVGDPLDPATRVGPLLRRERCDEMRAWLDHARDSGALVERPLAAPEDPRFFAPAIVSGLPHDHPLVQEETFGPILVVERARDFDAALARLNGVRQGLAAALFSPSPERRRRFSEEARAGLLSFGRATPDVDVTLPFGGVGASSVGPFEHGSADREFQTRPQALYGDE